MCILFYCYKQKLISSVAMASPTTRKRISYPIAFGCRSESCLFCIEVLGTQGGLFNA
jgi:hypothetical protein